jgi:hypothetical protein
MLQIETQSGFKGFGNGQLAGECQHCSNMVATPFGFCPFFKNTTEAISGGPLAAMGLIRWMVQEGVVVWGIGETGRIISRSSGWMIEHTTVVASSGNGLIVDQTGRMLAMHDRYLSKKDAVGSGQSWTEAWKDFGTSVVGDKGMDTYLDWVVIPHGNRVGILNVTDDSFNNAGLTFPSDCKCIVARTNRTGVLLGVNMGSRSFVGLWDAQSNRSIADWIWSNYPLLSICRSGDGEWIVTTTKEIFITNGYTKTRLPYQSSMASLPDPLIGEIVNNPITGGTRFSGSTFLLAHSNPAGNFGRKRSGLYLFNFDTQLWQFIPCSSGATQNITMGTVFEDSSNDIYLSHRDITLNNYAISKLTNTVPSTASFISAPFGQSDNKKVAQAAKLELVANNLLQFSLATGFTVSVKVYNYSRPLWNYAVENGIAPATNKLNVDGTQSGFNDAEIGDEVTILTGANAGAIRHITNIASQNTANELWTLDSALPNLTEDSALINVQPFKLAKKFTVNAVPLPVDGLFFDIQNQYKGKKFLLKVVFENLNFRSGISVPSLSLIYDDLSNP